MCRAGWTPDELNDGYVSGRTRVVSFQADGVVRFQVRSVAGEPDIQRRYRYLSGAEKLPSGCFQWCCRTELSRRLGPVSTGLEITIMLSSRGTPPKRGRCRLDHQAANAVGTGCGINAGADSKSNITFDPNRLYLRSLAYQCIRGSTRWTAQSLRAAKWWAGERLWYRA
jgi:hypothetical protein